MIPWSRISTCTVYEVKYIHIHKDGNDYSCTCRPLPCRQATIETGHDVQLIALETTGRIYKKKIIESYFAIQILLQSLNW